MIRGIRFTFAVLVLLGAGSLWAVESDVNFRQRVSGNDELAKSDITEEVRFGREVAARIIARYGLYDNPPMTKYVNLVGQVLVMSTNRPEIEFHFAVLNTDDINGYAAPGGYVFLTRGAIAKMRDESELAGALAHELGHIVEKHVVKELNIKGVDQSAATGLAMIIGGSTEAGRTAFAQAADQAMDVLFKSGYKREDETQADRDAALFCAMAGYDPMGLAHFFERMNTMKDRKAEVLDKTHPSYESRIAWIKGTISQEGLDAGNFKINKERFAENVKQMK